MVICGDISLPNISWDSVDSASGANVLPCIEALHDHFLTQINNTPTRGSNILDQVIISAPEHIKVTEVLAPDKAGVFTDHCVVLFEYNSLVNASSHPRKFVYHYANGDFEGLREALSAISVGSLCGRKSRNCFANAIITFTTPLTLASDSIPSAYGQFEA